MTASSKEHNSHRCVPEVILGTHRITRQVASQICSRITSGPSTKMNFSSPRSTPGILRARVSASAFVRKAEPGWLGVKNPQPGRRVSPEARFYTNSVRKSIRAGSGTGQFYTALPEKSKLLWK